MSGNARLLLGRSASLLCLLVTSSLAQTTELTSFPMGRGPFAIAFDGTHLWVTQLAENSVTKVRPSDGARLGTFPVVSPRGITSDGGSVWITNYSANTVTRLRTSDGANLGTFPVAGGPQGILFDGSSIWVASTDASSVTKLRASDGAVLGTRFSDRPLRLAFDGTNIWVSSSGFLTISADNKLAKFRASDFSIQQSVRIARAGRGMIFDGQHIWIANEVQGTVSKLRLSDETIAGVFDVGSGPTDVAFDGNYIWVANRLGNSITQLRAADGERIATIPLSGDPVSLAIDSDRNVFATNHAANALIKIAAVTPPVTVTVGTNPTGLGFAVDGTAFTTIQVFEWQSASVHTVGVASPQTFGGSRYNFLNWSNGGAQSHSITATQAETITASFSTSHLLTINTSPAAGGSVATTPASIDGFYNAGSVVQLSATPNPGFVFTGYTGDVTGTAPTTNVTMTAPKTVTGNFHQCSFALSVQAEAVGTVGGQRQLNVTASNPACTWAVQGAPSWVTIQGGTGNRTGSGAVGYTVAENTSQSPRTATLTIAGLPFVVSQSVVGCTFAFTPLAISVSGASGSGNIELMTQAGCQWQASTTANWVTFSSSGTGSASIPYTVQANPASRARIAVLAIAGNVVTLTQAGAIEPDCSLTLATSSTIPASGGTQSITVTVASGCAWQAISNASWLGISTGATGTGNGAFTIVATANTDPASRTGTVTVNGQVLTVTQSGTLAGLRFVPVAPCRIMDTRTGSGLSGAFGAPVIEGGSTRELPIPLGPFGIPAGAKAYSVNVTVVPDGPMLQYLTLWPTGEPRPLASTLNSFDGKIVANAALVPAGVNGAISIFVTERTQVIIDVNGYFVP